MRFQVYSKLFNYKNSQSIDGGTRGFDKHHEPSTEHMRDVYTPRQNIKTLLDFVTHKNMIIDRRHYLILKIITLLMLAIRIRNVYDL